MSRNKKRPTCLASLYKPTNTTPTSKRFFFFFHFFFFRPSCVEIWWLPFELRATNLNNLFGIKTCGPIFWFFFFPSSSFPFFLSNPRSPNTFIPSDLMLFSYMYSPSVLSWTLPSPLGLLKIKREHRLLFRFFILFYFKRRNEMEKRGLKMRGAHRGLTKTLRVHIDGRRRAPAPICDNK